MRRFRSAEAQIKTIYDNHQEESTEEYPAHVTTFFEFFEWRKRNSGHMLFTATSAERNEQNTSVIRSLISQQSALGQNNNELLNSTVSSRRMRGSGEIAGEVNVITLESDHPQ